MRIAIIGTHSTGKTELVEKLERILRERGKDVRVIKEVARRCPHPLNKQTTLQAQEWILKEHLKEEEAKAGSEILISDRCLLDNYIYMLRRFPEKAERFLELVLENARFYDFIFKTTLDENKPVEEDGFRDPDPNFRKEIDRLLEKFLEKHGIPVIRLPKEGAEKFILKILFKDE